MNDIKCYNNEVKRSGRVKLDVALLQCLLLICKGDVKGVQFHKVSH